MSHTSTAMTKAWKVPKNHRIHKQNPLSPWLFTILPIILTCMLGVGPFINTIRLSFTDSTLLKPGKFVGVQNYIQMFQDPQLQVALLNSTIYAVCMAPCMVLFPLILAVLLNRKGIFISICRVLFYIPAIAGSVASALIWTNVLSTRGLVNSIFKALKWITEPIPFLQDRWLILFSAMCVTVWGGLGYYMVIYLAALANIDDSLYEAAEIDGAGSIRQFFYVTIPGVRLTMILILLLSTIAAFRVFNEVYMFTGSQGGIGGEDTTMVMLIMRDGTGLSARTGYTSALSMLMFFILVILTGIELLIERKGDD